MTSPHFTSTTRPGAPPPTDPGGPVGHELHLDDTNLGAIDEIIERGDRRYFVLDSRHWTFGERRVVPAELVEPIERPADDSKPPIVLTTHLSPGLVRDAPGFDPFRLADDTYWSTLDRHYDDPDQGER